MKTCFKEDEAANACWDEVKETDKPVKWQIFEIKLGKWNGSDAGAWQLQLQTIYYGSKELY